MADVLTIDAATGARTERAFTADEKAAVELAKQEYEARVQAIEAVAAAKVSARAKLKALGLTDNEIAALVG